MVQKDLNLVSKKGITDNDIFKGIAIDGNKFTSETLITHKSSNYKQIITKINYVDE